MPLASKDRRSQYKVLMVSWLTWIAKNTQGSDVKIDRILLYTLVASMTNKIAAAILYYGNDYSGYPVETSTCSRVQDL